MSIRMSVKKVTIAAAMVAPLVLASCSSGDSGEDTTAAATTTQSSTTTSSTTTEKSTTEETTTEEVVESTTEESAPEPSPEAPQESAPTPAPEAAPVPVMPTEEHAPVEQGQAASPEDAAAIDSLIRGALAPTTLRAMMAYVPQNTCSRVIERSGGQAAMDFSAIPDIPVNQIPGAAGGTIDSITDIMVEGDTASAWVVASGNGQTDSATQRFLREGGQWKFCD